MPGPRPSRARALAVLILLVGAGLLMVGSGPAGAASIGQLQQQIGSGQGRISSLSGALGATNSHLAQLNASIAALQQRIARVQAELDANRAKLFRIEEELTAARNRLHRLEVREAHSEAALSRQMVNRFEADQPDLVTVVLESSGFQDLLERITFAERVQKQDVRVVTQVKAARRAVAAEAVRLGALEVKQRAITARIVHDRDTLVGNQTALIRQRLAVAQLQSRQQGALASAQNQVASLRHQLAQAQAAQAAAARRAAAQAAARATPTITSTSSSGAAAPPASTPAPAPAPPSSGGFVFPLPKSAASSPGTWSLDQGVDISAPGDTPEYAVCSGTIVLHGIGGFGSWAPVLHCDSPLDGYDYVYYGHAGPADQLPVGTHVGAGQVMSSIGPGIVGISTGPHLEIGFSDSSGSPIGPQTAGAMMSLLQSAY